MKDFKKSTIYQIYPKSFKDSNGDGIGDINGVIEKLDYLNELGVDYIWLTPFYRSPQNDNGYDVADYTSIDPVFGTMDDFERLVKEANSRDIQIMLDMVFNHTSTEHEWFQKALAGEKEYKDYYIFKKSKDGEPPTNWISKFGGPAWEYVAEHDEYYLHLFDRTQADLNWENPRVRQEIFNVVNFWMDKGVKGFRLDVINLISKPDIYENDNDGDGRCFYTDGPKIHQFLKEMNEETFGKDVEVMTVGEMSSTTIDHCIKYSSPVEKELSMVFSFHHLKVDYKDGEKWSLADFDFRQLKEILSSWQYGMQEGNGWNALFWCNHDQPRIVSRFGNDQEYHKESAKMLATAIHMLRGTPYIYQGEEIGMTNPKFNDIGQYRDVESINYYDILKEAGKDEKEIIEILQAKSRDNSRTPMQWEDTEHAGFTKGTPWISVPDNAKIINAEHALKGQDSIFHHYQKLIFLRKKHDIIAYGDYQEILGGHDQLFAYVRSYEDEKLLVINNFYAKEASFEIPKDIDLFGYNSELLLSNYIDSKELAGDLILRPYESLVYLLKKEK
ncbi:alpha,alpha-phosphotrehalase [Peribacillus simplex]|jgi:trehalose-6-phosphate hydrolase|uniref:alpha,alpha-phosphotrehalase n=1 Tax=Peribacillus simplex TaxID=1478 RepID=UPI0011A55DB7|nr:alpha,alpha-phosphotrehalase [Peribacillus simplex]